MIINIHAGHNPDGKVACGAVGYIRESTESRKVKNEVISLLKQLGHTVYDCTCENGVSQADVLTKIITKCNTRKVDLDVSIHFNAGAKNRGDGITTGTEAYLFSAGSQARRYAEEITKEIAKLGFRNRGVKTNPNLYYLRKTKSPAVLIECCFVDDKDDVDLYDYQEMASAIVLGITGQKVPMQEDRSDDEAAENGQETTIADGPTLYRVQIGSYSRKINAEDMKEKLRKAGFDAVIVKA